MRGLLTSLKIQSKWSSLKEIHQISSVKIAKSVLASAAHILKKNCKENGSIFAFYLTEICGIVIVYMHFFFYMHFSKWIFNNSVFKLSAIAAFRKFIITLSAVEIMKKNV